MRRRGWTGVLLAGVLMTLAAGANPADRDGSRDDEGAPRRKPFADRLAVLAVPQIRRPAYLVPFTDPDFGSTIQRIAGDTGGPIGPIRGDWGADARHTYSKQQPWSSDGRLIVIQNRGGNGSPEVLILDGATYRPKFAPCEGSPLWDYRWHPSKLHPHEMINVDKGGRELSWFDVTTCRKTRRWTLPIEVDYGIGSGEGNPSNDGRFVALGNARAMFVVDMDPRPPYAPYPNRRIGPVYSFPPCSLDTRHPDDCKIDNLSVSASGKYVVVKYDTRVDSTEDAHRVYEVDPGTLALKPHVMAGSSVRCGSFAARPNGWIFPLKHSDLALDPFDHDEDVVVGGRSCPGSPLGHVVKVRLRDGRVTSLTDPSREAPILHVSTRNLDRPGWAYASYYKSDGKRFSDEIVAVRMDGSGQVERLAHMHSVTPGCYRCEPHAVPSRDGSRVIFASNWAADCGPGCGPGSDIKDYVVIVPGAVIGSGPKKR